jgi:hypothetical protein
MRKNPPFRSRSPLPVPAGLLDLVCETIGRRVTGLPVTRNGVPVTRELAAAALEILNEEFTRSLPVETRIIGQKKLAIGLDRRLAERGHAGIHTAGVITGVLVEAGICRRGEVTDSRAHRTCPVVRLLPEWTWNIATDMSVPKTLHTGAVPDRFDNQGGGSWLDRCPVCRTGILRLVTGRQLFGVPPGNYVECAFCRARLVPEAGGLWRLVSIGTIRDPSWRRLLNRAGTGKEWQERAGGSPASEGKRAGSLKAERVTGTGHGNYPEGIRELGDGSLAVECRGSARYFIPLPVQFDRSVAADLFSRIKTPLRDLLAKPGFSSLKIETEDTVARHPDAPAGGFLHALKREGKPLYRKFLNPDGDREFRNFRIKDTDSPDKKGVFLILRGCEVIYVCCAPVSFRKAIGEGIGLVLPSDCLRDGETGRCRVNAEICREPDRVRFFTHIAGAEESGRIQRCIIRTYQPGWNSA